MERTILHCDLNSFYASVELLDHPELRDRPVAVCGDPESRHGIILAKNEPAKAFQVKTAETIWQARRKCPDLVLLPAHHSKYRAYSQKVNAIYERYTDPGGALLHRRELAGRDGHPPPLRRRRKGPWPTVSAGRVREELGLTVSVGVSFNKVFAKMGSDYKKPDATTVVTRENFQDLLWPLPVTDLRLCGKGGGPGAGGVRDPHRGGPGPVRPGGPGEHSGQGGLHPP